MLNFLETVLKYYLTKHNSDWGDIQHWWSTRGSTDCTEQQTDYRRRGDDHKALKANTGAWLPAQGWKQYNGELLRTATTLLSYERTPWKPQWSLRHALIYQFILLIYNFINSEIGWDCLQYRVTLWIIMFGLSDHVLHWMGKFVWLIIVYINVTRLCFCG